jgi:hypothetical protein
VYHHAFVVSHIARYFFAAAAFLRLRRFDKIIKSLYFPVRLPLPLMIMLFRGFAVSSCLIAPLVLL